MAKKKRKPRSVSLLRKDCDALFSKIVRSIGHCARCGTTENLQCAHVVPRTYLVVRWDRRNARCLCVKCHLYWWHKDVTEAGEWFKETYPNDCRYLQNRRLVSVDFRRQDYIELKDRLTKEWKEINA